MHPRFVLVLTEHFSRAYPFRSSAFTQNNPHIQLHTSVIQGHLILKPEVFCKKNSKSTAFTWEQFPYKSYTNLWGKKEQDRLGSSCLSLLITTDRILALPGKRAAQSRLLFYDFPAFCHLNLQASLHSPVSMPWLCSRLCGELVFSWSQLNGTFTL